jgi:hypothetical protein
MPTADCRSRLPAPATTTASPRRHSLVSSPSERVWFDGFTIMACAGNCAGHDFIVDTPHHRDLIGPTPIV